MEKKKLLVIFAAAAIPLVLIGMLIAAGMIWYLGGQQATPTAEPLHITLCDVNASSICVISFGVDPLDQMVINLRLPREDYPVMYALVLSRNVTTRYPCQVVEDYPGSVFCSGPKTPLSESIDVTLVASGSNQIIAKGTFIVMAFALPSPVNFTLVPQDLTQLPVETATRFLPPVPGATQTISTAGATMTPPGTTRPGPIPTMTGGTPLVTATHSSTPTGTITPATSTSTPTPTYTPTP